jgi:hypothetical protein
MFNKMTMNNIINIRSRQNLIQGQNNYVKINRKGINSVYIFTNARDEPNIAEWISHHILLGFDKVIVFDHLSIKPIEELVPTTFNNKLQIIKVNGKGNIKIDLMKRAVRIATQENADWMLYLDADEFLSFKIFSNVKEYLAHFNEADMIGVNWLFFGCSGFEKQPSGLITENFIRSDLKLDRHVKTFVRPLSVINIENPHYYLLFNPNRSFNSIGGRMRIGPFNYFNVPFVNVPVYIAHYVVQSIEEYTRRKGRPMDDGTPAYKSESFNSEIVKRLYNEVLNHELKIKYSKRTKEFLKENNIEL